MKPHISNFINAFVLIGMSSWGYLVSPTPSITSMIPAAIGVLLLACHRGVKKKNKAISHIAVVLTLLIFLALIMPLIAVVKKENILGIVRVSLMMFTSLLAFIVFVISFITARKQS